MKKKVLVLAIMGLMTMVASAQVTKTLSVVPGGLYKALTQPERATITHLTLTGSLDARDFKTMRDAMPNLQVIDMTKVEIAAYDGDKGCEESAKRKPENHSYSENVIPPYAFYRKGNGSGKRTITSVIFPKNLEGIGERAFYACYGITEATFPETVKNISTEAYYNCKALTSITVEGNGPIEKMGKGVFFAVDPSTCIIHVKAGTKAAFEKAKQWGDFMNIEEAEVVAE